MSNQDVNALGFFFAGSPNLPLRQKLALAMLARNKKFPTNLGEGIASIGQEIGDTLAHRSILEEDKAAMQAAATATVPPIADSAVPPTAPPRVSTIPDNEPTTTAPPLSPPPPRMRTVTPAPIPPPDGTPGNTGATTFQPPFQPPPPPLQPPPGLPPLPQQAATPPAGPVVAQGGEDPRRAVGLALLRQQTGGAPPPAPPAEPPPRPTVADFGQPSALAATPPQAIPAAPPPPSQQIRAIPPQGPPQPEAIPGYVPPQPGTPQGAPTIQPGPREQQLQAFMAANSGNIHMAQSKPARELQMLVTERERKQKEADKLFEAEVASGNKQKELRTTGLMDQYKRIVEGDKGVSDARIAKANADFLVGKGREREPFLKEFAADKEQVSKVAGQLRQTKTMDEAIRSGALSGMGADFKLNLNRVAAGIGSQDAAKVAAATEQYQIAAKSLISYGTMLVNGKDPRVTDSDLKQAQGITGDINLQQASQKKILDVMREDMYGKINEYEDKREFYLRGDPQHRMFKVDVPETAPKDLTEILLKHRNDPNAIAIYDRDHGKGAAALEIKRALRRENRANKVTPEDD